MPDDETTQRTYERATSGRRPVVTRRRLVLAAAVVAAAGVAGGLSLTLGGGGRTAASIPPPPVGGHNRPGIFMPLIPLSLTFHGDAVSHTLTSIDARVNNTHYANATLVLEVLHSGASQPSAATPANTQSVFEETEAMTSTGASGQDVTVSNWSGTLTPSDWTGGCQDGIYRVRIAVYPAGASVADPFTSSQTDRFASGWFACTGVGVDGATGASGPSGSSGPTGSVGPTGSHRPIAY